MSVSTINNTAAQLYSQQKPAPATLQQQNNQAATVPVPASDAVQISEQARALFASTIPGNGAGIEPPKTASASTAVYSTLGNGAGIEPPK